MEDSNNTNFGTNLKTSEHLRDATITKWLEFVSKSLHDAAVSEDAALAQWLEDAEGDPIPKKYLKYILWDWYIFLKERKRLPGTWDCPLPSCDEHNGTFSDIITHLDDCQHIKEDTRRYVCPGCRDNIEMPGHTCIECQAMDYSKKTILKTRRSMESFLDHTPDETAHNENCEDELTSDHKILLHSEAYRRLISVFQRSVRLNGIDPVCMVGHRKKTIGQLPSNPSIGSQNTGTFTSMTPEIPPPLYVAKFGLSWDLLNFLREEYEGENLAGVVDQVVTLTGDGHLVQAATCRDYIEQVWPTTGSEFMDLVENVITQTGQRCKCMLLAPYSLTITRC